MYEQCFNQNNIIKQYKNKFQLRILNYIQMLHHTNLSVGKL